jgi:predicted porin
MKKSLLALAVLGAFAGAASAQTNVTLYGIADAGIGMSDNDAPGGDNYVEVFSGVQSTSRFGIRGSEDLGSGLKATFNIEAQVNFDTGESGSDLGNGFWQRRAVVGVAGGFGEVRIGRDYTPGFTAAGTTDVMGYGLFGNWLTYTAQNGGVGSIGNGITTRASNGIHYTSPSWGGFTLRAMYATGEADDVTAPSNSGDMYGLSAVYAAGPLTVSGYYQRFEYDNGLAGAAADTETGDQYGIGAQYRFGAFRVAFNYGMADVDLVGGGSGEHEGWGLGAGVKLGVGEVLVNYIQQELDVPGIAGTPEGETWGIAYVHPLSKRTNLYATYGQTDNKNGAAFGLNYSGSSVAAGDINSTPRAFAVGVRHLF